MTRLTKEQWNIVINEAMNEPLPAVAERHGVTIQGIKYQLDKRGIKRERTVYRKHKLQEDYFDTIDTEEKAYWLGFIVADGCVGKSSHLYKQPNRLSFNLSVKDIEQLEKLRFALGSSSKITTVIPKGTYSTNPISRFNVNSVHLCASLSKYGVAEQKTGNEVLPDIPMDLMRHFIRGFFDGDGSITSCSGRVTVNFTSNTDMLLQLRDFLHNAIGTSNRISVYDQYEKQAKMIQYGGQSDVRTIYHYLYDDATVYLERKYNKFTSLLSK